MNQHKQPCNQCPFRRDIKPGFLQQEGAPPVDPGVYVGQIVLPFWLPCHCDKNFNGKQSDANEVSQCAGAAIFRANIGNDVIMPKVLLRLPANTDTVFASLAEFYAHHKQIPLEEAEAFLTPHQVRDLALKEWRDVDVKAQFVRRKNEK